jgi:catechol 2,3-dioxygenase-like lactoylglutathione lyase family enzyme
MKLNHLDLQVSDVRRSAALFVRLFGFQLQSSATSPAIAILGDGDGFTLVLQRRKNDTDAYPEGFHCGFLVHDVETVRRFHLDARASGLVEVSEIIENGRGVLVYCRTWDGLTVEVSCPRARPTLST